jgi:hypothetical protein
LIRHFSREFGFRNSKSKVERQAGLIGQITSINPAGRPDRASDLAYGQTYSTQFCPNFWRLTHAPLIKTSRTYFLSKNTARSNCDEMRETASGKGAGTACIVAGGAGGGSYDA